MSSTPTTRHYERILFSVEGGVATLTFNNPAKRNAFDPAMRAEIAEVVRHIQADKSIRALVLTGAGAHFCSGGDLGNIAASGLDNAGWRDRLSSLHHWLQDFMRLDIPVVAAVEGAAYGAGFSLALAADFIIASTQARFAMSFIRVGVVPDCAAFYTLPRIVGVQRAKELMLSGREVRAPEALQLGIATEVVEPQALQARAQAIAHSFVGASPIALSLIKRSLAMSNSDLPSLLEQEANAQALAMGTQQHREAVQAFLDKKPAPFQWPEGV